MTDSSPEASGPAQRSVEIGLALLIVAFAGVVIFGSVRAGIDWGAEGPRAGFFPFYVGLLILISGAYNFVRAVMDKPAQRFADWGQLRQVLAVVAPTGIYVLIIPWLGFYVASFVLIALFMRWLGRYAWTKVAAIAMLAPLLAFFVFEKWFLVPLPKGPLEEWLGL